MPFLLFFCTVRESHTKSTSHPARSATMLLMQMEVWVLYAVRQPRQLVTTGPTTPQRTTVEVKESSVIHQDFPASFVESAVGVISWRSDRDVQNIGHRLKKKRQRRCNKSCLKIGQLMKQHTSCMHGWVSQATLLLGPV